MDDHDHTSIPDLQKNDHQSRGDHHFIYFRLSAPADVWHRIDRAVCFGWRQVVYGPPFIRDHSPGYRTGQSGGFCSDLFIQVFI